MPICRNCNSRISKFDKDRCPVCGTITLEQEVISNTIHCEATSEPHSWKRLWNEIVYGWGTPPAVVWGYTEE